MKLAIKKEGLSTRKSIVLALILIYVIYEPEFSKLFLGIHSYFVNVIGISIAVALNYRKFIHIEKRFFWFSFIIVACALYTMAITALTGNEIRFFQHIYVIFQIFAMYLINLYVDDHSKEPYKDKIKFRVEICKDLFQTVQMIQLN